MKQLHVLIVDDDDDLRDGLQSLFEEDGYRVSTASDGEEALSRLAEGDPPDVVVLDLMMPGADGWEFRSRQRQDPRFAGIPVVAMTASGRGEARLDELGADGFLQKPFDFEDLLRMVLEVAKR